MLIFMFMDVRVIPIVDPIVVSIMLTNFMFKCYALKDEFICASFLFKTLLKINVKKIGK